MKKLEKIISDSGKVCSSLEEATKEDAKFKKKSDFKAAMVIAIKQFDSSIKSEVLEQPHILENLYLSLYDN